jgi:hypothetical protein
MFERLLKQPYVFVTLHNDVCLFLATMRMQRISKHPGQYVSIPELLARLQ